jgi:hypothetical protein
MTVVRRNARLAKRPALPAMERAQRNLCRKLGIKTDKLDPIDDVLCDFISMFQRPLLEHIVAAMSALFDLDNDDSDLLDNALLRHVGPVVAELAPFEEAA